MKVPVESTGSHGYAKIGKRCFGQFNWGAKGLTNAIGALLNIGLLLTVSLFSCNVDSDVFSAWLTQDLLPKAPVGCVIIMDNASFHKRDDILQRIQQAGCIPEFLPPYFPDLNPIEHSWFQIKSIPNKVKCSVDQLFSPSFITHLFYSALAGSKKRFRLANGLQSEMVTMLEFAVRHNIESQVEHFLMSKVNDTHAHLISGKGALSNCVECRFLELSCCFRVDRLLE